MAQSRFTRTSNWLRDNWRSLAFVAYVTICLFDFIIMPVIYQIFNIPMDAATLTHLAMQFKDPNAQIQFLKLYGSKEAWIPLTMGSGGTFHMAFGGILTAGAWTRGNEKIAMINQGMNPNIPDNPDRS